MKTEHPTGTSGPPDDELRRIDAELRALGEPPLDAALEADGLAATVREGAVLTAFALAHPASATDGPIGPGAVAPLGELDRQRVWRKVIARRGGPAARPSEPSWRATWVAVATAAGLALVPMLSPHGAARGTSASRASLEALGAEARSALEAIPGDQDGDRAARLAEQYAAQMSGAEAQR